MRFGCPHAGYTITLRVPVEEPDPYHPGRHLITREGIQAQFRSGDFTLREKKQIEDRFYFNGLGTYEGDNMTPLDVGFRIGTFDTDMQGYDEKTKAFVEEKMQESMYFGNDYILLELVRLPAPWPGYDKLRSPKKIVELVDETGSDVEDVIAYERENANRGDVIDALEALLVPAEDDATVISA